MKLFESLAIAAMSVSLTTITNPVSAAPTLVYENDDPNTGNVIKILDLEVSGEGTFDVTWMFGTLDMVFGGLPGKTGFEEPTFWNNEVGATKAVDDIRTLLNGQVTPPNRLMGVGVFEIPVGVVFEPSFDSYDNFGSTFSFFQGIWRETFRNQEDVLTDPVNLTKFTPSQTKSVPEPSILIGFGVLGLGLISKKLYSSCS